jgi:hypothetical protein
VILPNGPSQVDLSCDKIIMAQFTSPSVGHQY